MEFAAAGLACWTLRTSPTLNFLGALQLHLQLLLLLLDGLLRLFEEDEAARWMRQRERMGLPLPDVLLRGSATELATLAIIRTFIDILDDLANVLVAFQEARRIIRILRLLMVRPTLLVYWHGVAQTVAVVLLSSFQALWHG